MNAIGSTILALLVFVVLFAPKRWAMLAMVAGVLCLTQVEVIELLGINFFAARFLEMAGAARVWLRKEFSFSRLNAVDSAVLALYSFTTIVFMLRSSEDWAYQLGVAVDAFLCYFTFRGLIGGMDDFVWFLRAFALLLLPYVAIVSLEMVTGRNLFALLGETSASAVIRDGRLRCTGSFRHASLLGSVGATFLPLYIGLVFKEGKRILAVASIGSCLGIVALSNSGGPLSSAIFGVVGWLFWALRAKMYLVRRAIVGLVILLAVVMKAPVWYLPARVSSFTGGDGWHRSYLIDVAIRNIDQWWLAGMSLAETKDWFAYTLTTSGGADITNQYISFGINGGLIAIALFIFLLTRGFRSLGLALAMARSESPVPSEKEFLLWGLGVMLSVHAVNLLGITYFDQFYVIWFMQLAVISSISQIGAEPVGEDAKASAEAREVPMSPARSRVSISFGRDSRAG
jgi:hypothetical protein